MAAVQRIVVLAAFILAFFGGGPGVATARAQSYHAGEFDGWTTTLLQGESASGTAEAGGGAPGGSYVVRLRQPALGVLVAGSVSLSPDPLDPVELGLDGTLRIGLDLRVEASTTGFLSSHFASAAIEQGGRVYRSRLTLAEINGIHGPQAPLLSFGVDVAPGDWIPASTGDPPPNFDGSVPVRLGMILQTLQGVGGGQATIRFDNLTVRPATPAGPSAIRFVGYPGTSGGFVYAPLECFEEDNQLPLQLRITVEADRAASGDFCVDWQHDLDFGLLNMTSSTNGCPENPQLPALRRDGAFFQAGSTRAETTLSCRPSSPPSFVELLPGDGYVLGSPSRQSIVPCVYVVDGEQRSCEEESCAATVVFQAPESAAAAATLPGRGSGRRSAAASSLDVLRRVRDEAMAPSPRGRYYRDLYEAFSPELRDVLIRDAGLWVDVLEAAPAWIDALELFVDGAGGEATVTSGMLGDLLAILGRFEEQTSPALREVFRRERERLGLEDVAGLSLEDAVSLLEERGDAPPCATTDTSLCLQGGRFRVEVTWSDSKGGSGAGRAVPLSGDSGYFWFFDEDNVELVLKVLDGRGVNDRYWVFYGALSDVEYTVLVTDTETGALRAYRNPQGVFASVGDTDAFDEDGAPRSQPDLGGGSSQSFLARLSAAATETLRGAWGKLRGLRRESVAARGTAPLSLVAASGRSAASVSAATAAGSCVGGANALCLGGNRFRVEVEWRNFEGGSGFGMAAPLTADTGTFWFFDPSNTELIVKVLDGRAINDHFWVYYGALSNVEYTLRVTDTATGQVRVYENPSGVFASRGDVEAF